MGFMGRELRAEGVTQFNNTIVIVLASRRFQPISSKSHPGDLLVQYSRRIKS